MGSFPLSQLPLRNAIPVLISFFSLTPLPPAFVLPSYVEGFFLEV